MQRLCAYNNYYCFTSFLLFLTLVHLINSANYVCMIFSGLHYYDLTYNNFSNRNHIVSMSNAIEYNLYI